MSYISFGEKPIQNWDKKGQRWKGRKELYISEYIN